MLQPQKITNATGRADEDDDSPGLRRQRGHALRPVLSCADVLQAKVEQGNQQRELAQAQRCHGCEI